MSKHLKSTVLRVTISLCSLGILIFVSWGKFGGALSHLSDLSLFPLILGVVIYLATIAIISVRLKLILSLQKVALSFSRLYYLGIVSLFFSLFLPSAVGGDIAKAYYIYKDCDDKMATVSSILIDRFLGLAAAISLGYAAFFAVGKQADSPQIGLLLLCLASFILAVTLLELSQRFSSPVRTFLFAATPKKFRFRLEQIFSALRVFQTNKTQLLIGYGYSVVAQILFIFIVSLLARSLHVELPLWVFFLLIPVVTVCSLVPSVGGLGVREVSSVYLFSRYIAAEQAVALSFLIVLFIYGIGAACGILYAFRGGASIREIERIE